MDAVTAKVFVGPLLWAAVAAVGAGRGLTALFGLANPQQLESLPFFAGLLLFVAPLLAPPAVAGLVGRRLIAKAGPVPRFLGLYLSSTYLATMVTGIFASSLFFAWMPAVGPGTIDLIESVLRLVVIPVLWIVIVSGLLPRLFRRREEGRASPARELPILSAQLLLVALAALSWLPGIGTLVLGGGISVAGLTALALWITGRRGRPGEHTSSRLTPWLWPAVTLLGILVAIGLDA